MMLYTNLYKRVIYIKIKISSFNSQIKDIKKANSNLKANVFINLTIYFGFFLNYFFNTKDILNI